MLIQFQSGAKPQTSEQQLEKLCAWIDSHIDESIGWPELIQQSGLDFNNIQYIFSRYKSTTPMTWIRNRRLELHETKKKSLNAVAYQNRVAKSESRFASHAQ
ncbi:MAG: AraC family transcriptional regulator [Comamonadaceae bacterium]|nr:MAG: AraC family transcriptional regulator [Comamonadaceae bacterium]